MIGRDASGVLTLRPAIELGSVGVNNKPTVVTYGANRGYSLPIYAADDEELYIHMEIPGRWDGVSDFTVTVKGYLSGAEDLNDDFQLQLSWSNKAMTSGVVSDSVTDVEVDTNIEDARKAQYSAYEIDFTIDWDGPATDVAAGDHFAARLRRIATAGTEMAGEFVVTDIIATFNVNKTYKVA